MRIGAIHHRVRVVRRARAGFAFVEGEASKVALTFAAAPPPDLAGEFHDEEESSEATAEKISSEPLKPQEVADHVYVMMVQEIRLNRERGAR